MKSIILAVSLFMAEPDPYEVTLRSKLSALSNLRYENFRELSIKFIEIGNFRQGNYYVIPNEKTVQTFTECVDIEYTPMYTTFGHDTEIGVLFIGCAYKLGWMH